MKFNIDNYTGKYVMRCKTEEESKDFCDYLHSIGKTWRSGTLYPSLPVWDIYKRDTCYDFNAGESSFKDYYENKGYTILEWSDFMNKKEFTKEDLKTGDIVTYRNGKQGIIFPEYDGIISDDFNNYINFNSIMFDLINVQNSEWDIMKVQRVKHIHYFTKSHWNEAPVIWERQEIAEMTLEEVCKALGKEIKIVKSK